MYYENLREKNLRFEHNVIFLGGIFLERSYLPHFGTQNLSETKKLCLSVEF